MIKKLIEVGAKILDILDESAYIMPNGLILNCEYAWTTTHQTLESIDVKKNSIFDSIVGYSVLKKEFVKALDSSSPVFIL